ncbi:hypothetical protein ES707_15671 [subsurface metagenome]
MAERVAITLTIPEVDAMIADIEARGGDAEELKKMRAEISNSKWLAKQIKPPGEEEYLEEKRAQSQVEHGTDLECMICHQKFDHLVSGACEVCWREWMLGTKTRG